MNTLIVEIPDSNHVDYIANMVGKLNGVSSVKIQDEATLKLISGLPYTNEERITSVRKSMEDVRANNLITAQELKKRVATW